MKLKEKIKEEPGFQYVVDHLELMSAVGREMLLRSEMECCAEALGRELDRVQKVADLLQDEQMARPMADLKHRLMELQDIGGTISRLQHHTVLDEVEMYELKHFAYVCMGAGEAAERLGLHEVLEIPDLADVFDLLDPDHTRIPTFYIYDSYHPGLPALRKQLRALQNDLEDPEKAARYSGLFDQQNRIEHEVLGSLSDRLSSSADRLHTALERMGYADVLVSKASQAVRWHLTRPDLLTSGRPMLRYESIFNPRLLHRKQDQGLRYQSVDIELVQGLCLITGANMAGKTVALKTLGVAQLMCQFGMFVPAAQARMSLVDDVVFCLGDEQNEMNGLSSFASEIIKISDIMRRTAHEHLLVLIDEPARTTNPVEGKALVQSISELLHRRSSFSVITTHYSQLGVDCRRLRVKGFMESMVDTPLAPGNINRYMDYSLVPDDHDEVPQEALRIATLLGCDEEMISLAKEKISSSAQ